MEKKLIHFIEGGGGSKVKRGYEFFVFVSKAVGDKLKKVRLINWSSGSGHGVGESFGMEEIFINGLIGEIYDTLSVEFSEPVLCDSLKKNPVPIASFRVYGPDSVTNTYVLKQKVFEDAFYVDREACTETYIQKATIVTIASVDGIVPKKDSIAVG